MRVVAKRPVPRLSDCGPSSSACVKVRASIHKTVLVSMTNRGRYCPEYGPGYEDIVNTTAILIIVAIITAAAFAYWRFRTTGRPVPHGLRRGQPLPDFRAVDENGDPVRSTELHGNATVMLFVRGSWCPFCSSQVEDLTVYYKDIVDLGARLIFVTPKPLETTRRVAEFFKVEFDFWLDEDLSATKQLGLLQQSGVPENHRKEYGSDTIWPTALVIDRNGIIRYTELSKRIVDRPDPRTLLDELRKALAR